jgi:hypothetical protein
MWMGGEERVFVVERGGCIRLARSIEMGFDFGVVVSFGQRALSRISHNQ